MKRLIYLILLISYGALGKTWYADNGKQEGNGTLISPWGYLFAFDGADGQIQPLDTVTLLAGEYGYLTVTKAYSDWVTYKGIDAKFISTSEGDADHSGVIVVNGGEYIRFLDLIIEGQNPFRDDRNEGYQGISSGFDLKSGKYIDIIGCSISNVSGSGIYKAVLCSNLNAIGNQIKYCGYYSEKAGRYAHHGMYIQNWEGGYCNIEKNIICLLYTSDAADE